MRSAWVASAIVLAAQLIFLPVPLGVFVIGVIFGGLTGLVALGMALVHRANRILNFAQADLGMVPTSVAVLLISLSGLSYVLALAVGLAGALLVGGLVELLLIRRFFAAPRLILTVVILGVAQLLAGSALVVRLFWTDEVLTVEHYDFPIDMRWELDPVILRSDHIVALIVFPVLMLVLGALLRYTNVGTAIRATADRADRASLLGIPVKRLQTVVWTASALLSFIALFLRAGIVGQSFGGFIGISIVIPALTALVMGRLTNLPAVAASSIALGVLQQALVFNGQTRFAEPIFGAIVLVTLLLQRRSRTRAEADETSTWTAAEEVRPIPAELARLPEVRAVRWAGLAAIAAIAVLLPHVLAVDQSLRTSAVLIFAMIGVSLVVLTGWAGQISLGQMALVGTGAAVGAYLTSEFDVDLALAVLVSGVVGAVVATAVGLPALRVRGLYLAVATLAFGLATTSYFLSSEHFAWIPVGRVERKPLLGRIDITSSTAIYYVALGALIVLLFAVAGIRRSRTGRVLIALRDNEQGTEAFGVSATRAKLTPFAISGFVAAYAGAVFVHHQQGFAEGNLGSYTPFASIGVFVMVVIGGLGSLPGAVLGALYLQGTVWFLPARWRFLGSGLGVLTVLLVVPYGIGGL